LTASGWPDLAVVDVIACPQFMLKSVNTAPVSATFVCSVYPYTSEIPENSIEHLTGPESNKHWYQPI
jgi:hypothetical protein